MDKFGCVGHKIKVASGHYVDLQEPDPNTIDLESIAYALSKTCRYGGHCPTFYSVAEHCVLACILAIADKVDTWTLQAILLHDAAEAYLGDVVKPLKLLLPEYEDLEQRMDGAITTRFDVDLIVYEDAIKTYDRAMLEIEKCQMWPEDREEWEGFGAESRHIDLCYWSPDEARHEFLRMAETLMIEPSDEPRVST